MRPFMHQGPFQEAAPTGLSGLFHVNQDVVAPRAEGLPAPVDPDRLHSGSRRGRKLADRSSVFPGFCQRRRTAEFGVYLDLDRQPVVEPGIARAGESGDPATRTAVVRRSIPASGRRYALEGRRGGCSKDAGGDEDRPVIRGLGGPDRENSRKPAEDGEESRDSLPAPIIQPEHVNPGRQRHAAPMSGQTRNAEARATVLGQCVLPIASLPIACVDDLFRRRRELATLPGVPLTEIAYGVPGHHGRSLILPAFYGTVRTFFVADRPRVPPIEIPATPRYWPGSDGEYEQAPPVAAAPACPPTRRRNSPAAAVSNCAWHRSRR